MSRPLVIERVTLVGFGPYRDETAFDFPPGLGVLAAPNEAGKSTLAAAIRASTATSSSRAASPPAIMSSLVWAGEPASVVRRPYAGPSQGIAGWPEDAVTRPESPAGATGPGNEITAL